MQRITDGLRKEGKTIGFVATMGSIHKGHLSLVDISNSSADITVVSIFVNPTQFGTGEDYRDYPRDIKRDKDLLRRRGCSILFYPDVDSMYKKDFKTDVYVNGLSQQLCGITRKTHFKAVTTVVSKLFNIVKPNYAVFGQKDAQQAIIIRRMVNDLNYDIKIMVGPTVRERDGLAISSRNVYLTEAEREDATVIYHSLKQAALMIKNGERKSSLILQRMKSMISSKKGAKVDYIEVVETTELKPVSEIVGEVLIAVACYFGKARLIDNIIVKV